MKIAVLADTHGKLPEAVAEGARSADEIWHLGDFCDLAILNVLKGLGRPFYGVLGNNDWGLDLPQRLTLERGGKVFLLTHIEPHLMGGVDFLLHGHTHAPRDEMVGSTRVLNPGTVGKPNKGAPPSWALMTVDDTIGAVDWQIVLI